MIAPGLMGMPRRHADYADTFADYNLAASVGSYGAFASLVLLVLILATA